MTAQAQKLPNSFSSSRVATKLITNAFINMHGEKTSNQSFLSFFFEFCRFAKKYIPWGNNILDVTWQNDKWNKGAYRDLSIWSNCTLLSGCIIPSTMKGWKQTDQSLKPLEPDIECKLLILFSDGFLQGPNAWWTLRRNSSHLHQHSFSRDNNMCSAPYMYKNSLNFSWHVVCRLLLPNKNITSNSHKSTYCWI